MIIFQGNISKNFTQQEYHKGAGAVYYSAATGTFVRCLQQFRSWVKRPMTVVSWYRSAQENANIGGIKSSNHLTGTACDFRFSSRTDEKTFITYARKWAEICRLNGCVGEAGFYDAGWIHFGMQNSIQAKSTGHKFVHWHTTKQGKQIMNPYSELRGL